MKRFTLLLTLFWVVSFSGFSQNYCIPQSNCGYIGAISEVSTTGGLVNITNTSTCSGQGYGYFSTKPLVVRMGDSIYFTIKTMGYSKNGLAIFMDFNADDDFNDNGERVLLTYILVNQSQTYGIKIPQNAQSGNTRLRIRTQYYYYPSSPCSNYSYGETEDYPLTIIPQSGTDVKLNSIESPQVYASGNNYLQLKFTNSGADTITSFNAGFKIVGDTLVEDTNYTPTTAIPPGTTTTYTFTTALKLSDTAQKNLYVWISNPNAMGADSIPANDTIIKVIKPGLSGSYTIGSSGDYSNINAALYNLQRFGVSGPATFTISPVSQQLYALINAIPGASSQNTITFDGQNKSSVNYSYKSSNISILTLSGVSYLNFENITFTQTNNATKKCCILLENNVSHTTFESCGITFTNPGTNSFGIIANANISNFQSGYGNNANYITIKNCTFTKGGFGVYLMGDNNTKCLSNKIKDCVFNQITSEGIHLQGQNKYVVSGCKLSSFTNATAKGITTSTCSGGKIEENIINPGNTGISINHENYSNVYDSTMIVNNIIGNFYANSNQTGIEATNFCWSVRIYHNTIVMDGTTSSQSKAAVYLYYPTGFIVKNNILANMDKGYLFSLTSNNYYVKSILDYNDYYYPSGSANYFFVNNKKYQSLNTFLAEKSGMNLNHDGHSLGNRNPHFISSSNFHLRAAYPPMIGQGLHIHQDVDGDARCAFRVTIGADESPYMQLAPTVSFSSDDTLCYGTPITFINSWSDSIGVGFKWYVNSIYQGTQTHLTYTFGAGTYHDTIMLISENCTKSDTFTKIVFIDSPTTKPSAAFIASQNILNPFSEVTLIDFSSGCPSGWKWTISPDSIYDPAIGQINTYNYVFPSFATSQSPVVRIDYSGKYKVCLVASNDKGSDTLCIDNYIVVKPTHWMCQWATIDIQQSSSGTLYDDGGDISNYANNANCNFLLTPCSDTINFSFSEFKVSPGDFMRIYDGHDNNGTPLWNTTKYGANGITGNLSDAGFDTTYIATSGKMYFEWVTNNYQQNIGYIGEWIATEKSYPAPVASFSGPDTACPYSPVIFQNLSTGQDLTFLWKFEAGAFSNDSNGIYTYYFPGTYTVMLITENCGGKDTFEKQIVITYPLKAPDGKFTVSNTSPLRQVEEVLFTDQTTGCVELRTWSITPTTFTAVSGYPYGDNPIVIFNDTGCYSVQLITSYSTLADTTIKNCYIRPLSYCIPTVQNLSSDIGISRVRINTIDNSTSIGIKPYNDYSTSISTTIDRNKKYLLQISRSSSFNAVEWAVWIDCNIDGDFDDAGELVTSVSSVSGMIWSDSILIPGTAKLGGTKMRIGANLAAFPNLPCGVNKFGEYEDYKLIIQRYSEKPMITIIGSDTIYLAQCQADYYDSGAVAYSSYFGNLTSDIVTTNNLDHTYPGSYSYTYTVTDSLGNTAVKDRIIIVNADQIPPIVSFAGNATDTVEVYHNYANPSYTATDTCSGIDHVDYEGKVQTSFPGMYELKVTAFDQTGNTAVAKKFVLVGDFSDPVISLNGSTFDSLEVYQSYNDPGVTVTDNYDQTFNIQISGSIDSSILGTYTLTYAVTDSSGNGPVTVQRGVKVGDFSAPVISSDYAEGDTVVMEVFNNLPHIVESVVDNYTSSILTAKSGTYVQTFPTDKATQIGFFTYSFSAEDQSGNKSVLNVVIHVVDSEKPVITLVGSSLINMIQWQTFTDSAIVTDNYDKNIIVLKTGSYYDSYLKNFAAGFYEIYYNATDQSGNEADQISRYVNIETSGIEDETTGFDLKVIPNPAQDEFFVYFDENGISDFSFSIYNAVGKEIMSNKGMETGKYYKVEIEEAGLYLLRIENSNGVRTGRVVIVK